MRGRLDRHWKQWQSEYLKKVTSRKTGLKRASYFRGKLLPIGHVQWMYRNGVVHKREKMVYYKGNR